MKLLCTQENLNHGLFAVSHISTKNINLPILNNILLKAEGGLIKLLSTNLEIGISCTIRGKVEEDGAYTIQARLLSDYINLLPRDTISMELIEDVSKNTSYLEIISKNNKTKIKGLPASDFPLIPQISKNQPLTLPLQEFRQAIAQVIFAVSVSETRPEIGGVLMHIQKNSLILAATDSFRLAEKTITLKNSAQTEQKVIIPAKTLQEVLRILNSFKEPQDIEHVENITLYLSENQILFSLGNIEIISRLIEGQYPDYRQIIPTSFQTQSEITTVDILKAIKTASLFSRSGIYDIRLQFQVENKEVQVSGVNAQVGENESKITAEITGKNNEIVLNYRYLLDGLQNADAEDIILSLIDGASPCILRRKSQSDYLYIIMPIKQ